jgi:hypothetical protein
LDSKQSATLHYSAKQPPLVAMHAADHPPQVTFLSAGLQDVFRRKGAQELHILKDINGVLKPVSACSCMQPTDSVLAVALLPAWCVAFVAE